MKIGVQGLGTVGKAVADGFSVKGHEIYRYDPAKGYQDYLEQADIIFVCIPAPEGIIEDDRFFDLHKTIVIKSTVRIGEMERLSSKYATSFVYNPEFLCEDSAAEDFLGPDKIIIGCSKTEIGKSVGRLYRNFGAPIFYCTYREAEILKLAINSFYALKVIFANEIFDICMRHQTDYDFMQKMLEADKRIAPYHLEIFHKGYRGFDGKCLPKDLNILTDQSGSELLTMVGRINRSLTAQFPLNI